MRLARMLKQIPKKRGRPRPSAAAKSELGLHREENLTLAQNTCALHVLRLALRRRREGEIKKYVYLYIYI